MIENLENQFEAELARLSSTDPAHDLLHFRRVAQLAKSLCQAEKGRLEIVLPAAWLHDYVVIPKNDPRRSQASQLSAQRAISFLKKLKYPQTNFPDIAHAIEAHSFSANVLPRTLEARIVQDADRLDGLGAIGIARCFATAGLLQRPFYSEHDAFCNERIPNDRQFTVDHFYQKLFKVAATLQTTAGQAEGRKRVLTMKKYLAELKSEIEL